MVRLLPLVLIGVGTACAAPGPEPGGAPPSEPPPDGDSAAYVVMVSFDGMHPDMIERAATPRFDAVARNGVRASGLIPSYPSKTFPNHYSLATGLYPARHGLVDNAFYDPRLDATYRLGDRETVRDGRWYGGEPIWVTAEAQGVRTASFFWVGTEAEIGGIRPTHFKYYDGTVPYEARVDSVLHWLSLPIERRPRLVMLYFSEPDHTGHERGPDAPAVDSAVARMDTVLGRLLDGLDGLPIADRVHLVLVSDHGIAPAPADQVVFLDDAVDLEGVRVVNNATQALLYFAGDTARLAEVQRALNEGLEHVVAYRPEQTPPAWRYRGNPRIGDLVVAADVGWVLRFRDWEPWGGGGTHGWDPRHPRMRGIFLAAGPGVRPGREIPAFENVHVYPLVARLLGVEPAAGIDGRLDVLQSVLREPAYR